MAKQKVIGPWTIVDLINEGGNSWVWRAQRDGQTPIALKVLKSTDPRSEAYRRFVDEVEIMRRLGTRPGILSILDPSIEPSSAWLATPEALSIRDALGSKPSLDVLDKS